MRISTVPLTADNVHLCAPLWGGRETLPPGAVQGAIRVAADLLSTDRARGRLFIDDDGVVCAFGCSAFVTRTCADAIVAQPTQSFGTHLLLDASVQRLVLDARGVEHANADGGVDLLVVAQGYALRGGVSEGGEFASILGAMMHAFVDTHRGYNIVRIVNEVFGEEGMAAITSAAAGGLDVRARCETRLPSGAPLRSLCWTLTRDGAKQHASLLLPMFLYTPPRLRFTPAEQALLRSALRGHTDRQSSERLGVPLTAVKARWTRIQARVANELPALATRAPSSLQPASRGNQSRQSILEYVRDHPSELTPYRRAGATTRPGRGQ